MHLFRFIKSVGQEMRQVSWPNAKQTRTDTTTVVGTSILFALFFALVDWLIQVGLSLLA